ncbi:SPOR domain-containing protein [Comamonas piscis]|uniref:SPOR domain-containing protein n=1 Tax=Comamonas piscis TaxID=1562974 RepID=A0A7G5EDB1_9BURK|nr:SPOR domain-containing protein [Comamonas piscis]QMV71986.1 SPOR domain-containing protein [Comamonas piscis]WSO34731.1 SPOR domain-containing protein [Comamonas piscis]
MIRFAIVLLLLANAGYYAFSQGMLRSLGWAPDNPSEPERVQQQVKPEALRILSAQEAKEAQQQARTVPAEPAPALAPVAAPVAEPAAVAAAEPATDNADKTVAAEADKLAAKAADKPAEKPAEKPEKPEKKECLVAGSFDAKQVEALRLQLAKLPDGSWRLDSSTSAGRWMVYVGKFNSQEALDTRRDELRALDVSTDRARVASLEPGISLGRFSSEEAAERHLATVGKKGVSGAKVVVERPETVSYNLRLPKLDAATKKRVQSWHVMDGKELRSCS